MNMSFFEENNPPDITVDDVLLTLRDLFPDLTLHDINIFYHGSYNACEILGEYIFRIPDRAFRNERGKQMILEEQRKLQLLYHYLPVPIPTPVFFSPQLPFPYIGYRKIPGVSLNQYFASFSVDQQIAIAKQVGQFLTHLHDPSIYSAFLQEFPEMNAIHVNFPAYYREIWQQNYLTVQKYSFPLLTSVQIKWTDALYQKFLSNSTNFDIRPVVIHGDFDTSNILIDPTTRKITGVIDFEETRISDPATDLLFFNEGKAFQTAILNSYQRSHDLSLQSRREFLYCRTALAYLTTGAEWNRIELIEEGRRMLQRIMRQFP